ncbi:MAG: ArnT family glycosyltransferase [Candidatus Promineifilaceae bacterium]
MSQNDFISTPQRLSAAQFRWAIVALLLLVFGLAVTSLAQKSPTFDEQGFLVRGLGYLRGENRHMRVGHPLGLNALNASLLVNDSTVSLPTDDPSWQLRSFHRPAELFLWEIGNDVEHIMFLARVPTVWLSLLLVCLIARFTYELTNQRLAGLIAAMLVALDPNMLAHSRLTTTDFGLVAGALLATYTLWRWLNRPNWQHALFAGFGFGLLQNTKFTAGLFVPLFALVILIALAERWQRARQFPLQLTLQLLFIFPLAGLLTLWAAYGFEIGTLPNELPTMGDLLGGRTIPLAHHIEQLTDIGGRVQKTTPSFLLGEHGSGWWYYFPIAFLLKTPLPTLLLGVWGVGVLVFGRKQTPRNLTNAATILIPSFGFLAISMTNDINIGYRHILVLVPFVAIFSAEMLTRAQLGQKGQYALIGLLAWLLVETLFIAPDFLAYFNQLAGGPRNGWRSLVDSNIDWGQDLRGLAAWTAENEVDELWLSYFGEARPDYYGIPYRGLDSVPPRLMPPDANPLYPPNPAPGIYAISATNLQGVQFADHDQFAWFRERDPIAKIGYSIFIYDVAPTGAQTALLLPNQTLQAVPTEIYDQLGTNDVRPIWYDPNTNSLAPAEGGFRAEQVDGVWQLAALEPAAAPAGTLSDMGVWSLWENGVSAELNNNQLDILTTWQVQRPTDAALRIFIHALDAQGNIIGQSDLLNVNPSTLAAGDVVMQQHQLTTADTPTELRIGLYDWQTGERFGDPVVLPFAP